ncbi:hypothetical protein IJV79_01170 [bacterium]|nr:hypothetical protein [bacterium]
MVKSSGKFDSILTTLGTNNSSQIATAVLAGFKMFFIPLATAKDKNATPEQKKYTMTRDIITEGLALTTYIGVTGQMQKHATVPICSSYYKNKAKLLESGKLQPAKPITTDEINFLKKVSAKKINENGMGFLSMNSTKPKVVSEETKQYITKLNSIVDKINGTKTEIKSVGLDEFTSNLKKNGIPKEKKGFSVLAGDFKNAAKNSTTVTDPTKLFQNTRIAISQACVWVLALGVIPPLCNAIITPVMKKLDSRNKSNDNAPQVQNTTAKVATVGAKRPNTAVKTLNYHTPITNSGNMRV